MNHLIKVEVELEEQDLLSHLQQLAKDICEHIDLQRECAGNIEDSNFLICLYFKIMLSLLGERESIPFAPIQEHSTSSDAKKLSNLLSAKDLEDKYQSLLQELQYELEDKQTVKAILVLIKLWPYLPEFKELVPLITEHIPIVVYMMGSIKYSMRNIRSRDNSIEYFSKCELVEAELKINGQQSTIYSMVQRQDDLEQDLFKMTQKCDQLSNELYDLQQKYAEIENNLEDTRNELSERDKELEGAEVLQKDSEQLHDISLKYVLQQKNIENLQLIIAQEKLKLEDQKKIAETYQETIKENEYLKKQQIQQKTAFGNVVNEKERSAQIQEMLKQQLQQEQKNNKKLTEHKTDQEFSYQMDISNKEQIIQKQTDQINELEQENQRLGKSIIHLEAENQELQNDLNRLNFELENAKINEEVTPTKKESPSTVQLKNDMKLQDKKLIDFDTSYQTSEKKIVGLNYMSHNEDTQCTSFEHYLVSPKQVEPFEIFLKKQKELYNILEDNQILISSLKQKIRDLEDKGKEQVPHTMLELSREYRKSQSQVKDKQTQIVSLQNELSKLREKLGQHKKNVELESLSKIDILSNELNQKEEEIRLLSSVVLELSSKQLNQSSHKKLLNILYKVPLVE